MPVKFQRLIAILKGTSLIDPFDPYFASMGHRKDPSLLLGFFFLKIGQLFGFKYTLVTTDTSETASGLCGGLLRNTALL